MAQPEKVTFYSSDPDLHVGMTDQVTGTGEIMVFVGGKYETSNPAYIARLDRLADTADIAIKVSRKPPSKEASK
jgi:hypothetical protein